MTPPASRRPDCPPPERSRRPRVPARRDTRPTSTTSNPQANGLLIAGANWSNTRTDEVHEHGRGNALEIEELLGKQRISHDGANRLRGPLQRTTSIYDFADRDLVIEAAFEDLSIKQQAPPVRRSTPPPAACWRPTPALGQRDGHRPGASGEEQDQPEPSKKKKKKDPNDLHLIDGWMLEQKSLHLHGIDVFATNFENLFVAPLINVPCHPHV